MWSIHHFDVIVETLTGSEFEVTVTDGDTIGFIKSQIQRHEGIPVNQQSLIYKDRVLTDEQQMQDIPLVKGSRLKFVLGMKGGPVSARRVVTVPEMEGSLVDLNDLINARTENLGLTTPIRMLVYKNYKKNIHRYMKCRAERKKQLQYLLHQRAVDMANAEYGAGTFSATDEHNKYGSLAATFAGGADGGDYVLSDASWLSEKQQTMDKIHAIRTALAAKRQRRLERFSAAEAAGDEAAAEEEEEEEGAAAATPIDPCERLQMPAGQPNSRLFANMLANDPSFRIGAAPAAGLDAVNGYPVRARGPPFEFFALDYSYDADADAQRDNADNDDVLAGGAASIAAGHGPVTTERSAAPYGDALVDAGAIGLPPIRHNVGTAIVPLSSNALLASSRSESRKEMRQKTLPPIERARTTVCPSCRDRLGGVDGAAAPSGAAGGASLSSSFEEFDLGECICDILDDEEEEARLLLLQQRQQQQQELKQLEKLKQLQQLQQLHQQLRKTFDSSELNAAVGELGRIKLRENIRRNRSFKAIGRPHNLFGSVDDDEDERGNNRGTSRLSASGGGLSGGPTMSYSRQLFGRPHSSSISFATTANARDNLRTKEPSNVIGTERRHRQVGQSASVHDLIEQFSTHNASLSAAARGGRFNSDFQTNGKMKLTASASSGLTTGAGAAGFGPRRANLSAECLNSSSATGTADNGEFLRDFALRTAYNQRANAVPKLPVLNPMQLQLRYQFHNMMDQNRTAEGEVDSKAFVEHLYKMAAENKKLLARQNTPVETTIHSSHPELDTPTCIAPDRSSNSGSSTHLPSLDIRHHLPTHHHLPPQHHNRSAISTTATSTNTTAAPVTTAAAPSPLADQSDLFGDQMYRASMAWSHHQSHSTEDLLDDAQRRRNVGVIGSRGVATRVASATATHRASNAAHGSQLDASSTPLQFSHQAAAHSSVQQRSLWKDHHLPLGNGNQLAAKSSGELSSASFHSRLSHFGGGGGGHTSAAATRSGGGSAVNVLGSGKLGNSVGGVAGGHSDLKEFRIKFGSSPTLMCAASSRATGSLVGQTSNADASGAAASGGGGGEPPVQASRLDAVPFQYRRGYTNLNDACLTSSTTNLNGFRQMLLGLSAASNATTMAAAAAAATTSSAAAAGSGAGAVGAGAAGAAGGQRTFARTVRQHSDPDAVGSELGNTSSAAAAVGGDRRQQEAQIRRSARRILRSYEHLDMTARFLADDQWHFNRRRPAGSDEHDDAADVNDYVVDTDAADGVVLPDDLRSYPFDHAAAKDAFYAPRSRRNPAAATTATTATSATQTSGTAAHPNLDARRAYEFNQEALANMSAANSSSDYGASNESLFRGFEDAEFDMEKLSLYDKLAGAAVASVSRGSGGGGGGGGGGGVGGGAIPKFAIGDDRHAVRHREQHQPAGDDDELAGPSSQLDDGARAIAAIVDDDDEDCDDDEADSCSAASSDEEILHGALTRRLQLFDSMLDTIDADLLRHQVAYAELRLRKQEKLTATLQAAVDRAASPPEMRTASSSSSTFTAKQSTTVADPPAIATTTPAHFVGNAHAFAASAVEIAAVPTAAAAPPAAPKKKLRCAECNKRLGDIMVMQCRCERVFCAQHRYAEAHNCTFDYRRHGKLQLERDNPVVVADKVAKF